MREQLLEILRGTDDKVVTSILKGLLSYNNTCPEDSKHHLQQAVRELESRYTYIKEPVSDPSLLCQNCKTPGVVTKVEQGYDLQQSDHSTATRVGTGYVHTYYTCGCHVYIEGNVDVK